MVHYVLESRLVGRRLEETAVAPGAQPSGLRRPLLVLLHGRGMPPDRFLSDQFFAAMKRLGGGAPVVVLPNGGGHSYWHDRSDGRWGSYVTREVIPSAIRRFNADPERIAIGGISMGGFGALDMARRRRFCAVGAHSPALWLRSTDTAPGAFDDAADFSRHDVVGELTRDRDALAGVPVWIDLGSDDPFREATTYLATNLRARSRRVSFHRWPGGHNQRYWDAHIARYLDFYARSLARC